MPGAFYSTRISIRLAWINSVISETVPDDIPILQAARTVEGPFVDELGVNVDISSKVVTLPAPPGVRFYRLNYATELRIVGITLQNGNLVFRYQ